MKIMIASDIHGSEYYCRKMIEAFNLEKPDRMLLLGDILYHGPRNDLPKDYAPKKVISMLNPLADKILCVRGNCDTEVDQMVLDFPIMAEYAVIYSGNRLIYATHRHNFGESNPPKLCKNDILLCGHTHIPKFEIHESFTYINPGSVSIPKENSQHSYMTLDDGRLEWKTLDSIPYMEKTI